MLCQPSKKSELSALIMDLRYRSPASVNTVSGRKTRINNSLPLRARARGWVCRGGGGGVGGAEIKRSVLNHMSIREREGRHRRRERGDRQTDRARDRQRQRKRVL